MSKIKTNRVMIMCFRHNVNEPIVKVECDKFDGSAWVDMIRQCYDKDLCDYVLIEPVTINVPDIF